MDRSVLIAVLTTRFAQLPYKRVIVPDAETRSYTAQVVEFPGCVAQGDSVLAAYENLERAAISWILAAHEMGQEIPEPEVTHG